MPGLGLVGLTVAHLGATANVVTDGDDDCIGRLASNAEKNGLVEVVASDSQEVGGGSGADAAGSVGAPSAATSSSSEAIRSFERSDVVVDCSSGEQVKSTGLTITRLLWGNADDILRVSSLLGAQPTRTAPVATSLPSLPSSEAVSSSPRASAPTPIDGDPSTAEDGSIRGEVGEGKEGEKDGFDLILAADVIYEEAAIVPLVATVCALLKKKIKRQLTSHGLNNDDDDVESKGCVQVGPLVSPPPPPNPEEEAVAALGVPAASTAVVESNKNKSSHSCGGGNGSGSGSGDDSGGKWVLSFARRNVPVQKVIDEAVKSG
jgi:hypothetical protein